VTVGNAFSAGAMCSAPFVGATYTPVGYSSTSPKMREKNDIAEAPIEAYFDEAENSENRWRKTSRGCKGAESESRFKARRDAWKVMSSLSPKGCKPVTAPVPVRTPACRPAEISKDPDIMNRGDNENKLSFVSSSSKSKARVTVPVSSPVTAPVVTNPDNTNRGEKGDENKLVSSRFVPMFPPQPTIDNGEESEKVEKDRSPESKQEGARPNATTGLKKDGTPDLRTTKGKDLAADKMAKDKAATDKVTIRQQRTDVLTEDKKTVLTAETERVSNELSAPATQLSDMEDDRANRGEIDHDRFALPSDKDMQEAISEINGTLTDAYDNALRLKKRNPAWYDQFKCLQCEKSGKETDCCQLQWLNNKGKNACKDPTEQAMISILPTVGHIAKTVAESLTWCPYHGCLNNAGKCTRQCESNKEYQKHSPVHGAMLIAGAYKRPDIPWTLHRLQEKAISVKEFYKEHRCCSIQDCNGKDDAYKKCCYELYQSGEGPNEEHHLAMNTASVIRDAVNPAFEAAKAAIEAGSSSEEITNAVLEEKTSREAKEQAAAKALAEEQAEMRSRMSGKGGKDR